MGVFVLLEKFYYLCIIKLIIMIFKHTQPKTEKDIKCDGDCMVRAVTIITNSEYSKVHKLMYNNGWRASKKTDTLPKTLNIHPHPTNRVLMGSGL